MLCLSIVVDESLLLVGVGFGFEEVGRWPGNLNNDFGSPLTSPSTVRMQKFQTMGNSRKQSGATLRHFGSNFTEPQKCACQYRARTWLQLMCCTLVLELGVLISGGRRKAEIEMQAKGCKGKVEDVT